MPATLEPMQPYMRHNFPPLKLDDVRVHEQRVVDYLSPYVFLVARHVPPLDKLYCDLHVTLDKSQTLITDHMVQGQAGAVYKIDMTTLVPWPKWL